MIERWKTLFDARVDVLLYDLTSTYFEGRCELNLKAKHGYSRDGRPDCRQVVIALVVTPDGLAYLVGTPRTLLSKLEPNLLDKPWEMVHEGMSVKLLEKDGELYVLALSEDRQKKENAMRRRRLKDLIRGLNALRRRLPDRDTLLGKVAEAFRTLKSDLGIHSHPRKIACPFIFAPD